MTLEKGSAALIFITLLILNGIVGATFFQHFTQHFSGYRQTEFQNNRRFLDALFQEVLKKRGAEILHKSKVTCPNLGACLLNAASCTGVGTCAFQELSGEYLAGDGGHQVQMDERGQLCPAAPPTPCRYDVLGRFQRNGASVEAWLEFQDRKNLTTFFKSLHPPAQRIQVPVTADTVCTPQAEVTGFQSPGHGVLCTLQAETCPGTDFMNGYDYGIKCGPAKQKCSNPPNLGAFNACVFASGAPPAGGGGGTFSPGPGVTQFFGGNTYNYTNWNINQTGVTLQYLPNGSTVNIYISNQLNISGTGFTGQVVGGTYDQVCFYVGGQANWSAQNFHWEGQLWNGGQFNTSAQNGTALGKMYTGGGYNNSNGQTYACP